jgi:endonuclease/exonuclease/phosphatase family metal-dependent hydrolase
VNIRVATYNIHKGVGMDGRLRPDRIVHVLREIDADVVALQEVIAVEGKTREHDQARFIAGELGFSHVMGEVRKHRGAAYGNVILSRFTIDGHCNYDLSVQRREERGCVRADVAVGGRLLHVFNVHLGTSYFERRHQGRKLVCSECITHEQFRDPRIVLGDFNEWTRGVATHLLTTHFASADIRTHLNRSRTYPGLLPLLHLDHIYYDHSLQLRSLGLHKSRTALIASDHLPLYAEFTLAS